MRGWLYVAEKTLISGYDGAARVKCKVYVMGLRDQGGAKHACLSPNEGALGVRTQDRGCRPHESRVL